MFTRKLRLFKVPCLPSFPHLALLAGMLLAFYLTYLSTAIAKEARQINVRIENFAGQPIQNISLIAFSEGSQKTERFTIPSLAAEQTADFKIPNFKRGSLRLAYKAPNPVCFYLTNPAPKKPWQRNNTVFLKPRGIAFSDRYKKPAGMIARPCDQIEKTLDESLFGTAKTINPLDVPAITAPASTSDYLKVLQTEAIKYWAPPSLKVSAIPVVSFRVTKAGALSDIKMKTSSNNLTLDDSCIKAIQSIPSLPPFPPDLKKKSVTVEIEFDYKIKKITQTAL